ncbi:uncharacterized protein LOC125583053 [Brassica napus]|uniref:uncharacterized protein LOC125583053 n=1 Tax=Brassica napus TaxID=3708 RepID=UPI00207A15F1|nr:uncharacterized protein LOC125583053 [Brassica napus]
MKGIDPAVTSHELHVDPTYKPIRQKRRKLGPERSKAVNEEVDRLLDAGFITEVRYPEWLANPVVVKKKNGIEANPKQISAILDLPSPKNSREVQRLTGRIAALNRFISRSTDKCLPFYELLRGNKRFVWDEKCEEAFNQLKHYLTTPPVLSKPEAGDTLSLYIAVTSSAVSSVLIREDRGEQKPIFYTSKRMTEPETRYPTLEKMALAVVTSARKLRPYFQSHTIEVLSNQLLRTVMQNTNQSGRLTKWAMELSEHDIVYKNRTAAKSQVLADFLIELTPELEQDLILPSLNWILHVDGSSTSKGSGAGVQLQSPTGELIRQSFSFGFAASNNEAEYESLIAALRLAKAVKAKGISAYCDSQLVVSQYLADYDVLNERMDAYLKLVSRGENVCADALAALGSKLHDQVKRTIPIHKIEKPSIDTKAEQTAIAAAISEAMDIDEAEPPSQDDQPTDWRKELNDYLAEGLLPTEKWDARRLKRRSTHYVVMDGELHRWTATKVLLKCISGEEMRLVMAETHEGAAGNHSGGRALALKVKNLGFYWPTMNADCDTYVRKCDKCQRHASTLHSPTGFLHSLTAPYPFMRWGMDIIGPMPASRQKKFILVLTDYFTKWVEAEA